MKINHLVLLAFELYLNGNSLSPSVAYYLPYAFEIHPADVCGFSLFVSTAVNFHCLNISRFIYPIFCRRTSWSFPVLFSFFPFLFSVTNNATKKILDHVIWCPPAGVMYVRGGVAGSQSLYVVLLFNTAPK